MRHVTKRKKPKQEPPELLAFLDRARKSAANSAPRKHHLVPASYLNRWSESGQIRVTHVDEKRSYLTAPKNAARETDYYRLESPQVDPAYVPPLLFETMLGELEDRAKNIIDTVLSFGLEALGPQEIADFAWFMAFQITRGHTFREEQRHFVNSMFLLKFGRMTNEGIRRRLVSKGMSAEAEDVERARMQLEEIVDGDVRIQPSEAAIIANSGKSALPLGDHLLLRNWRIIETPNLLVTSDEPVVMVGGPGNPRTERAGVATAGIVLFPLCPSAILAMFRQDMRPRPPWKLNLVEIAEVNREILGATSRWAFERPSKHVTERMPIPPAPTAFAMEGPMVRFDGGTGELYRNYRPTRWANAVAPPWPVERWWRF